MPLLTTMVKYTIMYTPKEGEDTRRNTPAKTPSPAEVADFASIEM